MGTPRFSFFELEQIIKIFPDLDRKRALLYASANLLQDEYALDRNVPE